MDRTLAELKHDGDLAALQDEALAVAEEELAQLIRCAGLLGSMKKLHGYPHIPIVFGALDYSDDRSERAVEALRTFDKAVDRETALA